jgi:hypothetical protein
MAASEPLEKLFSAAEGASAQARSTWVTFLLFATYLAITVGSTTHRDLFLESPVKLPLLDVELNLFTFYWIAPLFVVIFHLYLLVHLHLLASKLHVLNAGIAQELRLQSQRTAFRQRLDGFPLTQALAGPRKHVVQAGLVQLIIWVTVVLAPVVLLIAFQVSFLPYHSESMTWWHRICLLVDLALLWVFWPYQYDFTPHKPLSFAGFTATAKAMITPILAVAAIGLSVLVATVPDERLEKLLLQVNLLRSLECSALEAGGVSASAELLPSGRVADLLGWSTWRETVPRWNASKLAPRELDLSGFGTSSGVLRDGCEPGPQTWRPTAILFEGSIDHLRGITSSPLARNLVLPDFQVSDPGSRRGFELRGRDLRAAYLARAQLPGADLQGSILSGAMLDGADLTGAKFGCVDVTACANLEGASLRRTKLDRVDFSGARLARARLGESSLIDALLPKAEAPLVELRFSDLRGADLRLANLAGAELARAILDGVYLYDTNLIGGF